MKKKDKTMTMDLPPVPPAVVKFAEDNGYNYVKEDKILSDNFNYKVFQAYSDNDSYTMDGEKIRVFGLVYILLQDNKTRFATEDETVKFIKFTFE